jgi:DNA-binding MurR/RpiR family transcriptional regulator
MQFTVTFPLSSVDTSVIPAYMMSFPQINEQSASKLRYLTLNDNMDKCRKLNCEGFSEFKIRLEMHLKENKKTTIRSSQQSVVEFFERTLKGDIEEKVRKATCLVTKANNVIFIGIGSSGILEARYFSSLGKFSLYIKDPHFPIHSKLRNNSVTIALSVSGENNFTVTHLNILKQEGSKIISITNNKLSTIAKISDINIPYYVTEEFFEEANITTQVPVVYILESIAREVHKLNQ